MLGGVISPMDEFRRAAGIASLVKRVSEGNVREVIFALSSI